MSYKVGCTHYDTNYHKYADHTDTHPLKVSYKIHRFKNKFSHFLSPFTSAKEAEHESARDNGGNLT